MGLVIPAPDEAARLAASFPTGARRPAWWGGRANCAQVDLVVSPGALTLNTQALPLLEAGEAAGSAGLAILAPAVSDEALATLLVNGAAGVFPGGILPLRTRVPAYHVAEVLEAVAAYLGVATWDGRRGTAELTRLERLEATAERAALWREAPSLTGRVVRWLWRASD